MTKPPIESTIVACFWRRLNDLRGTISELDVLPNAKEIRFLRGRLKFGDAKNSAPFPSMLVIFESPSVLRT